MLEEHQLLIRRKIKVKVNPQYMELIQDIEGFLHVFYYVDFLKKMLFISCCNYPYILLFNFYKEVFMKNIVIDSDEIANYFYERLIKSGFLPTVEETLLIADIAFDYLLSVGIIEEIEDE